MRKLKIISLFQRRILPWVILFSLPLGLLSAGAFRDLGFAMLIIAPSVHYWNYDYKNPQEYYYYHNAGLSRFSLWLSTLALGVLLSILIALL